MSVQPQKMVKGLKLYYIDLCSENKCADQMHGYRALDLPLCFRIYKKQVSHDAAHLYLP